MDAVKTGLSSSFIVVAMLGNSSSAGVQTAAQTARPPATPKHTSAARNSLGVFVDLPVSAHPLRTAERRTSPKAIRTKYGRLRSIRSMPICTAPRAVNRVVIPAKATVPSVKSGEDPF
jgi:hypothetical protein